MMKKYKAYLFDLYGTLVDIHTDEHALPLWHAMAAFYAENGADWRATELREAYFAAVEAAEAPRRAPGAWPEIDVRPVFAALFGAPGIRPDDARVAEAALLFRATSRTHLRAYAGAAALLDALRDAGARVFLLSNAQRCFTESELEATGLAGHFDAVYLSSDYSWKKPDARFFRALLDEQGLDAADCLMTGNDLTCDVGGARAVGMDSYFLHAGRSPQACEDFSGATYVQLGKDLRRTRRAMLSAKGE